LITSLDDYSRFLLYAKLVQRETSWTHILALQSVILKYGFPYTYYVEICLNKSKTYSHLISEISPLT